MWLFGGGLMKRWMLGIALVLLFAIVTGAGYLGFNRGHGSGEFDLYSVLSDLFEGVGLGGQRANSDLQIQEPTTVAASRGDVRQTVIAPGQLVVTNERPLGLDVGGELAALHAQPGDSVREGEVLARLEPVLYELALQEAQLRLAQAEAAHQRQLREAALTVELARARLAKAEAEHPRQLAAAQLSLLAAQARLAEARLRYPFLTSAQVRLDNAIAAETDAEIEYQEAMERRRANWEPEEAAEGYRRILEAAQDERTLAQAEYDSARRAQAAANEELKVLDAEVQRAEIALERLQAGIDPLLDLELKQAQERLSDLTAASVDPLLKLAVDKAQADLEKTILTAPISGVVLEVRSKPGERIGSGTELIRLIDLGSLQARVTVIEEDLPLLDIGQPVELFLDAAPEAQLSGSVDRILPGRLTGEDRPLYYVHISVIDLPPGMLPGMTIDASIIIAQRTDVIRLPRALLRAEADGTARVEVWSGTDAGERQVRVGLRGDVYVEILDGLREGERVVGQ
jgi:multidrug efflux pump subunit AcrA (membrane-fusion protein)